MGRTKKELEVTILKTPREDLERKRQPEEQDLENQKVVHSLVDSILEYFLQ